jgi:hypothetical protein
MRSFTRFCASAETFAFFSPSMIFFAALPIGR